MQAIVDHHHEPAPGASDITMDELNVRGPFFQYTALIKASAGAGGGRAACPVEAEQPGSHAAAAPVLTRTGTALVGVDGQAQLAARVSASSPLCLAHLPRHLCPPPPSPSFLQRLFQMYNRLPDYQLVRMAVTLLVGFIFGSLAWKQGSDTSTLAGVLNIAGLLFASTLFVGYTNSMTVQSAVEIQRWVVCACVCVCVCFWGGGPFEACMPGRAGGGAAAVEDTRGIEQRPTHPALPFSSHPPPNPQQRVLP
jgi:hypothetical protein